MRLGHLETVVLVPAYPEEKPQIVLPYGNRIDDREYVKVLDELMWSESAEKKAEIIIKKIDSLGDLLEILRDSEPSQEELVKIFQHFPPEIIAALMCRYPNGDFLSDERDINIYAALEEFQNMLSQTVRE